MSFLNPVNEPVLRFSSTDAGAPQINYNARVAGDVKTVLKACLVTGYGATTSAGWSVVNEVGHVAEFVSPSGAMSDYRLGIDDSTATTTNWYYQYQNARTNPNYSNPTKTFSNANSASSKNGWQLLVTERGIVFIELVQLTVVNKLSARITYWGQVKLAIPNTTSENIMFYNIGHDGGASYPNYFYSNGSYLHARLSSVRSVIVSSATSNVLSFRDKTLDESNVDLVSRIYLANDIGSLLVGELPPMLSKIVNKEADLYSVAEVTVDGRNTLSVCAGYASSVLSLATVRSRTFLIPLDYWEY